MDRLRGIMAASYALFFVLVPIGIQASVVSVDLGPTDASTGITNTQRRQSTDGENDAVTCGPADGARSGRTNRASSDDDAAGVDLNVARVPRVSRGD